MTQSEEFRLLVPVLPISAFRMRRPTILGRATSCCGICGSISWNGARRTRRRSCCCMAATSLRIPGIWSACTWRSVSVCWRWISGATVTANGRATSPTATTRWRWMPRHSSRRWGCGGRSLMGHSMGGRNAMLLTRRDPSLLRGLVIVDVGPELSDRGRAVIAGFVRDNEEFDDLEHFVRNVQQYDPYRSREHIERTVKYNMLKRADGKFVSKCDANSAAAGVGARQRPAGEHHAGRRPRVRPAGAAGAGREFRHPDGGGGGAFPRRACRKGRW